MMNLLQSLVYYTCIGTIISDSCECKLSNSYRLKNTINHSYKHHNRSALPYTYGIKKAGKIALVHSFCINNKTRFVNQLGSRIKIGK